MKRFLKGIICLVMFTTIFLCTFNTENVNAKVKLTKNSVKMIVRSSTTVKIKGTNKKVKWSSSNKKIVTVKNGKIKAVKKGNATIIAKVSGKL